MTCCLLVVKAYDVDGNPCYVSRFGTFDASHADHIAANLDHPDSTIADIVVMPEGFGAAMRNFNEYCVDPAESNQ